MAASWRYNGNGDRVNDDWHYTAGDYEYVPKDAKMNQEGEWILNGKKINPEVLRKLEL